MLADHFGGRVVFTVLMFFVAVPVALVPAATSYQNLLVVAFLLGMAGSSFAVGVGYVSRWFSMESQGSALGVYGLGNIGQSAAVFLGPVVAAAYGFRTVYWGMSIILLVWAAVFVIFARNAPHAARPKGLSEMLGVLASEPLAWALAALYFLTFGGFVAFSIYLPTLLRDQFGLKPADAGFRTAGFVVLATLCRPLGGWLSDRIGGSRVLSWILPAISAFGLLLGVQSMLPFTVGALGCAALLGIGNGAVFQLVPRYFPTQRATVTGLVGAMGGMGGFFPPLLLGFFRDRLGVVWPGFLFLSAVACVLWWMNGRPCVEGSPGPDPYRGQSPRGSLGHVVDRYSHRRHRARLTQPPELRPCTRDLYLRDHFCDLGRCLPLLRLDTKTSNLCVLAARMATVQGKRGGSNLRPGRNTGRNSSSCPDIYRETLQTPLGDASDDLLGMRAGGNDHVPVGIRMD